MLTHADFVNNAQNEQNIINMFEANIVMISYVPAQNSAGVKNLTVVGGFNNNNAWIGKNGTGQVIPVNTVKAFGAQANFFESYWCPYQSNDCKLAWLGNDADYMFTAKMDGCTFGIGSAAPSGGRMVCHANNSGDGLGNANNGQGQLDMIKGKVAFARDKGLKTLPPSVYFHGGKSDGGTSWKNQATTFGLRLANGTWKFYSQVIKYDSSAKTMGLVGVFPIA